jgi:hypothetical protein
MTNYQIAKQTLKSIAYDAKSQHRTDKPMVRMIINDSADSISRDLNLSDYHRDLLANYACTLHPKD